MNPTLLVARRAIASLVAAVTAGCGVPDVLFTPDDAAGDSVEAAIGDAQGGDDATADASADGSPDAPLYDGPYDGPAYCTPDGPVAPMGTSCCAESGVLCSGGCSAKACAACADCPLPNLCCSQGAHGTCKALCQ